jgi:hypothetical protein
MHVHFYNDSDSLNKKLSISVIKTYGQYNKILFNHMHGRNDVNKNNNERINVI